MDYPDSVMAKAAKGPEVRALVARGRYALCEYLDPETGERASGKKKLVLKDEQGEEKEYFIIPLKQARKSLLIEPAEKEGGSSLVWNREEARAEELW